MNTPRPTSRLLLVLAFLLVCLTPLPAFTVEVYDMRRAVEQALAVHPLIEAAQAGLSAAEFNRKSARGAFGPSASLSYGYSHVDSDTQVRSGTEDTFSMGADIRQNIFTGLRLTSAYKRTDLARDQQAETLLAERIKLAGRVQEAFLALLKAQENVASAEQSLTRLQEQLRIARGFYDQGMGPRLDILQAEVDVSDAEAALLMAQNTLTTSQARLNTLLVLPLAADVEYAGSLEKIPFAWNLEQCLAHAYSVRPDLRTALLAVDIARQDRLSTESPLYPQISANLGWSSSGDTPRAAGYSSRPTGYSHWSAGLNATWNIFSWGTTYYAGQQQRALEAKAKAQETDLRQEIAYEISAALLKLRETDSRVLVAEKGLIQAREAYRMALARYTQQIGTNRDVLNAQAALTQVEANLIGARAEYLDALAKLWMALGELKPDLKE